MAMPVSAVDTLATSCDGLRNVDPSVVTGEHWLNVNQLAVRAYCDFEADGGGWTLIGNYLHSKLVAASAYVRKDVRMGLPLLGSTVLGTDESTSTNVDGTWGHLAPAALMQVRRHSKFCIFPRDVHRKSESLLYMASAALCRS